MSKRNKKDLKGVSNKKEEDLKKWKNRIVWAERSIKERKDRWERAVGLYVPREDGLLNEDGKGVKVPFIYSIFATMLPSLFSAMPKVKAKPLKEEDVGKAILVESIVEDIFRKTKIYDEIRDVVLSSIIKGTGILKIGFKADIVSKEKTPEDILAAFKLQGNSDDSSFAKFKEDKGNLIDQIITEEGVWVKYIPNEFFFMEPGALTLESCKFVVHKVFLSQEEFKKKYKVSINESTLETVSVDEDGDKKLGSFLSGSDSKRCKVFEIWSKEDKKMYVVGEGYDKFLAEIDWPHDSKQYPFELLALAPDLESAYGVEVLLMLEDAANINNDMVAKQEDNAQRSSSGIFISPGAMDSEQKEAYETPGAKKVIEIENMNMIKEFMTPPVPPETYQVAGEMKKIMQETAHVSASVRQTTAKGKQTATEIQATTQASNVLTFYKVREIERFIENMTTKIIALVRQYYDQSQVTKIVGQAGNQDEWMSWVGGEIGSHSFSVKAGSAAHKDTQVEMQQKMQFLGQVMQLIQFLPNPKALIESLLTEIGSLQGINPELVREAFIPQQQVQPPPGMEGMLSGGLPGGGGGGSVPPVPSPKKTAQGVINPPPGVMNVSNRG